MFSGSSNSTAKSLRLKLQGLRNEEATFVTSLLPDGVTVVDDDSYHVCFTDLSLPGSEQFFVSRKKDAVVVQICGVEEREAPGAIRLVRPLVPQSVAAAVREAQLLARTAPQTFSLGGNFGGPATSGLQELAANYRFDLARRHSLSITIEDRQFHLFPQKYLYVSESSPRDLCLYRGMPSLKIEVSNSAMEIPSAKSKPGNGPPPRRLDEFLWHLGYNARPGRLLEWLDDNRAYRLTRWPPVVRQGNDSSLVKLGTLMARRTLRPVDLSLATASDIERVSDFLNGCTVVGCLESMRASDAPLPQGPSAKNPAFASLLGRIRVRLGLT